MLSPGLFSSPRKIQFPPRKRPRAGLKVPVNVPWLLLRIDGTSPRLGMRMSRMLSPHKVWKDTSVPASLGGALLIALYTRGHMMRANSFSLSMNNRFRLRSSGCHESFGSEYVNKRFCQLVPEIGIFSSGSKGESRCLRRVSMPEMFDTGVFHF